MAVFFCPGTKSQLEFSRPDHVGLRCWYEFPKLHCNPRVEPKRTSDDRSVPSHFTLPNTIHIKHFSWQPARWVFISRRVTVHRYPECPPLIRVKMALHTVLQCLQQLFSWFHLIYFRVGGGIALIWPLPVLVSLLCWLALICLGKFDGWHKSSTGGFSFTDNFFRLIFLPASDSHFADDTNQYRLVDGSEPTRQDQSPQNLLKCPGGTAHYQRISLGWFIPINLHSPIVQ